MRKKNIGSSIFGTGLHASEAEIYDARDRCPICLSRRERRALMTMQDSPHIELLLCTDCMGRSASHMPTTELTDKYYASHLMDLHEGITFHGSDRLVWRILRNLNLERGTNIGERVRIIDLGGGNGLVSRKIAQVLTQQMGKSFVEIDIVEYFEQQDYEDETLRITSHTTLNEIDGPYDLVLASAVLEHIPELNAVLQKLLAIAKPMGFFYARTPIMSPIAKWIKAIDMGYPAHVHDLGSHFWNQIPKTFSVDMKIVASQPSIVESQFSMAFARTLAAYILKLPGQLEVKLRGQGKASFWNLVGGWEVVLQKK